MKNIKSLIEERNALLESMNTIVENAEKETRNMNDDETSAFTSIEAEVRSINAQIEKIEQAQQEESVEVKGEKREMENIQEKEVRALEEFIRTKETRATDGVNMTSDGQAVMPTHVENNIVMKLDEASDVFAEARKLPSMSGSLKIPRENSISVAGFVGELEDVAAINLDLSEAELNQKRVGAFTGLTNQLVHDAAVDIVKYAEENLARAAARAIENSVFNGKGDASKEFKGITEDTDVAKIEADAITLDTLIDIQNALHPSFLPRAKFYMTRKVYNAITKLKDGNAQPYIQNGVVNGKFHKTLFEIPVVVTDQLTDEKPIVLGSLSDGYTIMTKKGMFLRHITGDSRNALRGSQLLVLDAYMDGVVHDPQAFVYLETKTTIEG